MTPNCHTDPDARHHPDGCACEHPMGEATEEKLTETLPWATGLAGTGPCRVTLYYHLGTLTSGWAPHPVETIVIATAEIEVP
jgi:hypothetical protein